MAHWRRAWRHIDRLPEILRCLATATAPLYLVADYLQLRPWPGPHRIEPARGAYLDVETYEDLVTAWIIFFRREYRLPQRAETIVDLGANIGCFSLYAARTFPAAHLVAFEPMPRTFARLRATLERNALGGRVTVFPRGAAAASGPRFIPTVDAPSQSLGIVPIGEESPAAGTTIDCSALDEIIAAATDLLAGDIDFLKIDIEGAEHEVMSTVSREQLQRVREIAMEYHPNAAKSTLFHQLDQRGFALVHDRVIDEESGVAHFRRRGEHQAR
jgi:FkbM family methyltransferase